MLYLLEKNANVTVVFRRWCFLVYSVSLRPAPSLHPRRSPVRFRYLLPCESMGFRLWRVVGAKRIRQFLARPWLSWQWISAAWILAPGPSRDGRLGAALRVRFRREQIHLLTFEVGDLEGSARRTPAPPLGPVDKRPIIRWFGFAPPLSVTRCQAHNIAC